ncbi:PAS domain S-box protein [Allomyces macrogynus ATCC 38327]|uniref:PAS domain S-box protein n=1 Tax=Allomyces macrogynus (strain ATCC 38327) TaxID=578462 RepID=A0A0L0SRK2_ALLM3|nr:PAS domain S-box protein [Allomyces macrogynus ATCC 38327]|eukprot:KNE65193.1 PAS domain S-box protein [Allomyces macrogynus ATCC 38327]
MTCPFRPAAPAGGRAPSSPPGGSSYSGYDQAGMPRSASRSGMPNGGGSAMSPIVEVNADASILGQEFQALHYATDGSSPPGGGPPSPTQQGPYAGMPHMTSTESYDGMPHGGDPGMQQQHQQHQQQMDNDAEDPINSWRQTMDPNICRIFENIRIDMEKVELNIRQAENEVFRKEEEAFFARQDEIEMNQLLQRQAYELARSDDAFESMLSERKVRKHTKKLQKQMSKEAKARDVKIRQQDTGKHMAREVRVMLAQHRQRFESLMAHMEARHVRQRQQLEFAQERKIRDQKALLEIETRGLREDLRGEIMKDFAYRINHQRTLDKHIADQLREVQQHELKQRKERFDAEAKALEEVAHLRAAHKRRLDEVESQQKVEYAVENERIEDAREKIKLAQVAVQHTADTKKLKAQHKTQIKMALRSQRLRAALRLKKWREVLMLGEDDGTVNVYGSMQGGPSLMSRGGSALGLPGSQSRSLSIMSVGSVMDGATREQMSSSANAATSEEMAEQREAEQAIAKALSDDQSRLQEQLTKLMELLKMAVARQKDELRRLRKEQADELRALEEDIQKRLDDLDLAHDTEMRSMRKSHEAVIAEVMATQQREYQMDASIRATERKMLTERRTLNSVLDAVLDAIINIDPVGSILRFNSAAEKMFGYSADEVLGKNIKMLTPDHVAVQHDQFLLNYLTTGVKKVIGIGRTAKGRKKDGSLFPIHLSVSEVKEEEFHLFTGIVRDLTEQNAIEEAARAEQARKQAEMESLIAQLGTERTKSRSLIQEILPASIAEQLMRGEVAAPTAFDQCTILYTDIVGFTSLASQSEPLDIVDMLNDLYTCFDDILAQYDVHKIETIGDCYVIGSGVPRPNGDRHCSEMAKLALHLLKAISTIRIRHRPDVVLKMRIGMHTGPIVAGVVGRKMPRYTLFGDTSAIASKMESTSLPMKVQISEATYEGLEQVGGFHFEARGEMVLPGRGTMKTYWLVSKDGFDPVVPSRDTLSPSPISAFAKRGVGQSSSSQVALEQHMQVPVVDVQGPSP